MQAFLWYFKIGGDQKWPHMIFMYKNMFLYAMGWKNWNKGVKKIISFLITFYFKVLSMTVRKQVLFRL